MNEQHVLVGKIIKAIELTEDRCAIRFVLEDGTTIVARCYADCCSSTWIEDVINVDAALGSPVLNAEDIELPEPFCKPTRHNIDEEEMQYYGFAVETANGRMTIAYRNSSNGYYGGSLSWEGEYGWTIDRQDEGWQSVE